MKTLLLSLATIVQAGEWNYLQHGADWGEGCVGDDLTNQTPINLVSPGHADFAYPLIEGVVDTRAYTNYRDRKVKWNGHTSQTSVLDETQAEGEQATSSFTSSLAGEHFGAGKGPITFEAQQYHFHAPSEHTIDGEYVDLEMHTVHYPSEPDSEGYIAAALGIMFSVDKYTAKLTDAERMVVDNFFESLQWDLETANPMVSNLVAYGDLVNIVDFNNRWVYQGSVTTPPCAQKVFWNEISTIYPISQSTLDNFKKQLDREYASDAGTTNASLYPDGLSAVGNYRVIQKEDKHNVMYVSNPTSFGQSRPDGNSSQGAAGSDGENVAASTDNSSLMTAIFVVLVITLLVALSVLGIVCHFGQQKQRLTQTQPGPGAVELKSNADTEREN